MQIIFKFLQRKQADKSILIAAHPEGASNRQICNTRHDKRGNITVTPFYQCIGK
jgi:hypothetical protein